MRFPIVYIHWKDASYTTHQHSLSEVNDEPVDAHSFGILIKKTRTVVTIAQDIFIDSNPPQLRRTESIPRSMIVWMWEAGYVDVKYPDQIKISDDKRKEVKR